MSRPFSGTEAIERARSGGYQLLISNLHMPGIDGQTLYARLRPQLPDLRWILLTGAGLSQRDQRFLAQTSLATLAEPFTNEQLVRQVFACLTNPIRRLA